MYNKNIRVVWLRRDLRLIDNCAIARALEESASELYFVYIFDPQLFSLYQRAHRRINFLVSALRSLDKIIKDFGGRLVCLQGDPEVELPKFCKKHLVHKVYANRDYGLASTQRDHAVRECLKKIDIEFELVKDQVIFEKHEVLNGKNESYKVFTPYSKRWLERLSEHDYAERKYNLNKIKIRLPDKKYFIDKISLLDLNNTNALSSASRRAALNKLKQFEAKIGRYHIDRDNINIEGTSQIGVYLRFGLISIREVVAFALKYSNEGARVWLKELIWREFYQMLFDDEKDLLECPFNPSYKNKWPGTKKYFDLWTKGQTGFPLIDASMRHFVKTGLMHNRLRMINASFLTKILLCDWRWGEKFFRDHLLDYDPAANSGGWQWASSVGCDAVPYFRYFNPILQTKKFDPSCEFIKCHLSELLDVSTSDILKLNIDSKKYPRPIIDYKAQRVLSLEYYKLIARSSKR